MRGTHSSIWIAVATLVCNFAIVQAFGLYTKGITGEKFLSSRVKPKCAKYTFGSQQCAMRHEQRLSSSSLLAGLDNENSNSESRDAANSTQGDEKKVSDKQGRPSGFKNALSMGPPLFAKFMIVLVVKFLTDLVVFPCLFVYRIARLVKRKIINAIQGEDKRGGGSTAT